MKLSTIMMAAALVAASSRLVLAQDAPATGGRGTACREDSVKFCADKKGPDRRACMEANMSKLSAGCKAVMAARTGK